MSDVEVGRIVQLTRQLTSEPIEEYVRNGMRASFANGFETGKLRALRIVSQNPDVGTFELLRLIEKEQPPTL